MKIPTAKKLPSGSWFIRVTVDGQVHCITRDTEKEVVAEAIALKAKVKEAQAKSCKTLGAAIDEYIASRENILSPSTIKGYKAIRRLRFQAAMTRQLDDINPRQWQTYVNQEAALCSGKTLKNAWCFIASVVREATGKELSVRLPQVVKADRPWLTPDEIPGFLKLMDGDPVEIPALLALSSLRRSELMGLTWKDIDFNSGTISIKGSAVYDENGELIRRKENKNQTSRRTIPMMPQLMAALQREQKEDGPVVTWHGNSISNRINRVCQRNGLPCVGLHGLRHSFASLAYHLNVPEQIAMQMGGWKDSKTMHGIYTHIAQKDITTQASKWVSFFQPEKCNENCND